MNLYTIVYYTSNKEDKSFEQKIQDKLLDVCGDIPIVSVSQKPMDLGQNICVGEVGASDHNLFRQIQIGCHRVETPYVISCEADCLYPPEYFNFIADGDNYYRFDNLWILAEWSKGEWGGFWPKTTAPFAQITKKEYYIKEIDRCLKDRPYWSEDGDTFKLDMFTRYDWKTCHIDNPILNFKTGKGMRRHTDVTGQPVAELPYWGRATDIRKEMFG